MAQYDELTALLRELLTNRFSPKPRYINGLLGDGLGNVVVPDRPDKVYARFSKESTTYFEIFNVTVPKVNNWPVKIGELPWNPGLTQVVGTNWSAFEQAGWGDVLGSTSPHAPTHEWPDGSPGSDAVSVHLRAIVPGRAFASSGAPTTIFVNSFEYGTTGTLWPGLPGVDLQPVMSATVTGTMRYAGVYVDESTNSLGVVTGGTTVYTSALEPPRVSFPESGVIPIARVRVYGGQAGLVEADIKDARRPWGSGGGSGGAPTDAQYVTMALNGTLSAERVLTAGAGIDLADGGAGGAATVALDIDGLTGEAAADDADTIAIYDNSAGALRKQTRANFLSGISGGSDTLTVKNTSGGAVVAGDCGYIDAAGEYKETTTFGLEGVDWCVVVTGGANNADIEVARSGLRDVAFAGTIPTVGNYVYTSTTAGLAEDMGVVWPGVFGIVKDTTGWASAGDTAKVLLYCNRTPFTQFGTAEIVRVSASSPSDFVATIAAAGVSGDKVYYNAPSSGALNTITPTATTQLAKIILHNFSRTEDSRIIAVGTDGGGNFIQVSSAGDIAAWTSGNTITARSQLVTNPSPPPYYYSLEITSSEIPLLTTALDIDVAIVDAGAGQLFLHPWITFNSAASFGASAGNGANTAGIARRTISLPVIERRLTFATFASGAAAATIVLRLMGGVRASP